MHDSLIYDHNYSTKASFLRQVIFRGISGGMNIKEIQVDSSNTKAELQLQCCFGSHPTRMWLMREIYHIPEGAQSGVYLLLRYIKKQTQNTVKFLIF